MSRIDWLCRRYMEVRKLAGRRFWTDGDVLELRGLDESHARQPEKGVRGV